MDDINPGILTAGARTFITCLLLTMFTIMTAFAQPESPCDCIDPIEIGETNGEEYVSNVHIVDYHCYVVRGTLIIDQPTWFVGVRLLMEEGSEILVEDDFSVDMSYLSACENMWKGIRDVDNENIQVYNSVIESAEYGIYLESVPGFVCLYNKFINNFIGVAVGSPFEEAQRGMEIQRGQLWGNEFFTDGTLPDPYPGQYYYPSWSTTVDEVAIDQGYAAIYLSGLTGLNVGYVGATGRERNYIHDMRNGVILRQTVGDVYGTDFASFEGGAPDHLNINQLDFNQLAIHAFWSDTRIEDNTVDDVIRGFWGHESYLHVLDNELSISTGVGSPLFRSRGVYLHRPEKSIIDDNIFTNGNLGVSVIEAQSPFKIVDNIFTRTYDQFKPGNTGIFVRGSQLIESAEGLIKENDITILDGNGSFGIYLVDDHDMDVFWNDISYEIDEGQDTQNRGIIAIGGSNNFVLGNQVLADPEYIDFNNWGMVLQNSSSNALECNTVDGFDQNIRIDGPNTHTQLISNLIYDANLGLELNSPSDIGTQFFTVSIGTQEHNRNKWLGTYTGLDQFGAHISGYDPVETAKRSRFIVDTGENLDFMPDPIGPSSVTAGLWFKDLPSIDDPGLACIGNPINPIVSPDTIAKILQKGYDYSDFNDQMTWLMKANVFDMILSDNSLLSNTVIDSFYSVEFASPLGILVSAQRQLASLFGGDREDKYLELDTMTLLAKDLRFIDSILFLRPSDSATWIALRSLKVDSLTENTDGWLDLLEAQYEATQDEYFAIGGDISGVTPTNDLEDYLKSALLYKTKYLLGTSFTGPDSAAIFDLAQLCLWEGGRAVNVGIELATTLDSFMIVTEENCPSPSPYAQIEPNVVQSEAMQVTFSPNPTSDVINCNASKLVSEITITDLSGKIMYQNCPEDKLFTLSPQLPDGIYLISAKDNKGNFINQFIFVQ